MSEPPQTAGCIGALRRLPQIFSDPKNRHNPPIGLGLWVLGPLHQRQVLLKNSNLSSERAAQAKKPARTISAGPKPRVVQRRGVNRTPRANTPTTFRDVLNEVANVNRSRRNPAAIDVVAVDIEPRDGGEKLAYDEL